MAPEARQLTRDDVDEVERELDLICSSIALWTNVVNKND